MTKYRVFQEFTSYDLIEVEADTLAEAMEIAVDDWWDYEPEAVGDYVSTGIYKILDPTTNRMVSF